MTWVFLAVVAAVLFWLVFAYNGMVALRQRVSQAYGDIDVQLKQRHDLVPNLVETVRGYATHERDTLDSVVQARNAALAAQGPGQRATSEQVLQGTLGRLIALGESYPDLKASANFQALRGDLSAIEDKLAAARRFFNNSVAEYNAAIAAIPGALLAGPLDFKPQTFFDLGAADRAALDAPPMVKF